jgi:hypothetical protein
MRNCNLLGLLFVFSFLILAAATTLSCGSSQHLLQSVSVSPATADANDYPDGQVQFTATGYFNNAPSPVTPLGTTWGVCYKGAVTADASINLKTGVAQCAAGSARTFTVFTSNESSGMMCNSTTACGGGCFITGTAQLTCP